MDYIKRHFTGLILKRDCKLHPGFNIELDAGSVSILYTYVLVDAFKIHVLEPRRTLLL